MYVHYFRLFTSEYLFVTTIARCSNWHLIQDTKMLSRKYGYDCNQAYTCLDHSVRHSKVIPQQLTKVPVNLIELWCPAMNCVVTKILVIGTWGSGVKMISLFGGKCHGSGRIPPTHTLYRRFPRTVLACPSPNGKAYRIPPKSGPNMSRGLGSRNSG